MNTLPPHDVKPAILAAALPVVAQQGWHDDVLLCAVRTANISEVDYHAAFEHGAADVFAYFSHQGDIAMLDALRNTPPATQSVRGRVQAAVMARLIADTDQIEAVRRAFAHHLMPPNQIGAMRCVWASADHVWRYLNDRSTDYNYYTKRTILMGVIATTRLVWLGDKTPDLSDTNTFLARRIENVMRFEKVKARLYEAGKKCPDIIAMLARLRYRN